MKIEVEFKFNIGDILQYRGSATSSKQSRRSWLDGDKQDCRLQVIEQISSTCHGGTQMSYRVRSFNRIGGFTVEPFVLTEPELELSEAFLAEVEKPDAATPVV